MSSCLKNSSTQYFGSHHLFLTKAEGGNACAHLIICVWVLARVLAQNLHDAPPALGPDAGACLTALRIIEPGFEFVRSHVDLLIEDCDDLYVGLAHRAQKRNQWTNEWMDGGVGVGI